MLGVVEMIRVELVDDTLPGSAGADERIDLHVLGEVNAREGTHLVGVVLPYQAFARRRLVRLADPGEQQ